MNDINYLTKLSATLSISDKLMMVQSVTNPKISQILQRYFSDAFTLAGLPTNGEISMFDISLALLNPTNDPASQASSIAACFYWLKAMNAVSVSEDDKTLKINLTLKQLEQHWNSLDSWFREFQQYLFSEIDPEKDLQTKITLAAMFQGYHDGLTKVSAAAEALKQALSQFSELANDEQVTKTVTGFTSTLKDLLAEPKPQPAHGRLESTLGE